MGTQLPKNYVIDIAEYLLDKNNAIFFLLFYLII